jgi:hypothetical protein
MRVDEYAKYVINNMNRATLGNALNISNKFNSEYNFIEFLNFINTYIEDVMVSKLLQKDKCYNILYLSNKAFKMYNSDFNYNKTFIIDDFIIELWQVLNGD